MVALGCNLVYIKNVNNNTPKIMTLDEYNELKLQDELNIGYEVEEEFPDEYEEDSYIDDLKTDGFNAVYDPLDELFGEPIAGYSLQ